MLIVVFVPRVTPFSLQLFKGVRVQAEMGRRQVEGALQSTQKDGILTVDQALVKQAWERVSNTVRGARVELGLVMTIYCCPKHQQTTRVFADRRASS